MIQTMRRQGTERNFKNLPGNQAQVSAEKNPKGESISPTQS